MNQLNMKTTNRSLGTARLRGIALLCACAALHCGGPIPTAENEASPVGQSRAAAALSEALTSAQLSLSPSNPQIAQGTGQQFSVRATGAAGRVSDVTMQSQWTVVDALGQPTDLVPDDEGLLQIEQPGRYVVTAMVAGRRLSTPITVTAATVKSIAVSPSSPSVAKGASLQFTAIATFTDATTQDVTKLAAWSVKDLTGSGVAMIDATGLLVAKTTGRATISARYKSRSASTQLEVTPAKLTALAVAPADPSIAKGTSVQFAAAGVYSDGTTADVTRIVSWKVTDLMGTGVASIDGTGTANGTSVGKATVSADYLGLSAATTLTVGSALPVSISISPSSATIPKGTTQKYSATATLSDGSTQDVTTLVAWTSVDRMGTGVASISAAGVAKGNAVGSATITATLMGHSASALLGVTAAVMTGVSVSPATAKVFKGGFLYLAATGLFTDGSKKDLTTTAVWTTADLTGMDIASVSSAGVVFGKNLGTARITAAAGGFSASAVVEVIVPTYRDLRVEGQTLVIAGFGLPVRVHYYAMATLTDGTLVDVSDMATWSVDDVSVATVDNKGLLTITKTGSVQVTARFGGRTASLRVFVY